MKKNNLISLILIFIGTMTFSFSLLSNAILVAPNYENLEKIVELGFFKYISAIEAVGLVLLFAGVVILVVDYVVGLNNKK